MKMSCCTKCGVPKPRVLTLVLLNVAIIVQVVSLALPEWSAIDTMYYQYPVKAYQNLWRENFIEDGGGNAFPKEESKIQNGMCKEHPLNPYLFMGTCGVTLEVLWNKNAGKKPGSNQLFIYTKYVSVIRRLGRKSRSW